MKNEHLDLSLLAVTTILGITAFLFPAVLQGSFAVFLVMVLFFGIPHGALDHILYLKQNGKIRSVRFYATYIGLILGTGLLWWLFPTTAFVSFLLISAYHFGQSQLYSTGGPGWLKHVLFMSWGSFLLSLIIFANLRECYDIFSSLEWLNMDLLTVNNYWKYACLVSISVFLPAIIYASARGYLRFRNFLFEIATLIVLCFIAFTSNAVFAFAIYFGIWHSFRSLLMEYEVISAGQKNPGTSKFVLQILPFTLLATVFLVVAYFLMPQYISDISPYMVFIIIISMLTVPHLFVMYDLYEKYS